ncbi:hypothetical protein EVAR_102629_1 [Eumeta japonica]|uniref:Uncharacterized protein n=1 Tax=Eumeta variegata TaxID=151549 RepID=A0A4C1TUU9_EUMVA|nr:hypothetical protein EVAR_102629_1 [Eumeta japonica]
MPSAHATSIADNPQSSNENGTAEPLSATFHKAVVRESSTERQRLGGSVVEGDAFGPAGVEFDIGQERRDVTLTEFGRDVAASAGSFRRASESPGGPFPPLLRSLLLADILPPAREADDAPVTRQGSRVTKGSVA